VALNRIGQMFIIQNSSIAKDETAGGLVFSILYEMINI